MGELACTSSEEGLFLCSKYVAVIRYSGCDHGFFEAYGAMPQAEDVCRIISEEIAKI